MTFPIPYTLPSITTEDVELVLEAATGAWGQKAYEYVTKFEEEFGRFVGSEFAVATSSCTGALHLGLSALGVGKGDAVVLADSNWVATAAPIAHLGATPVFVDILEDTWCIDPEQVERAITPNTRAIIATHLYGNLCDMEALLEIGLRHGIPVIEDAAEAIGSYYGNQHAGSLGLFGVFSFHGSKTITTGEGGMLTTSDSGFADKVRMLNNHGRSKNQARQFWPEVVGYKFRMSDIQAALGLAQLRRASSLVADKRRILAAYRSALREVEAVRLNATPHGTEEGAWMVNAYLGEAQLRREELLKAFKQERIDARVFFWPLSSLGIFPGSFDNPVANRVAEHSINLPTYHGMPDHEIQRVCDVLVHTIERHAT